MAKYIISLVSYIKLCILKYILNKNIDFNAIQSHSLSASIKLIRGSRLVLERNIQLSTGCEIYVGENAKVSIGQRTYFNKRCIISAHESIVIGEHCLFGPDVKIYDNNHVYQRGKGVISGHHTSKAVLIGNNCWVAANVIILKGAVIGNNCVIGAGCIIRDIVPDNSIVTISQNLKISQLPY